MKCTDPECKGKLELFKPDVYETQKKVWKCRECGNETFDSVVREEVKSE